MEVDVVYTYTYINTHTHTQIKKTKENFIISNCHVHSVGCVMFVMHAHTYKHTRICS